MSIFYEKYVNLCAKVKKSPSKVAEEMGFSRTSPNGWKKGKQPNETNLLRIAEYFGVSTDYFSENEKKNKPTGENSDELEMAELIVAFKSLSSDERKMALDYMRFQISQRKK